MDVSSPVVFDDAPGYRRQPYLSVVVRALPSILAMPFCTVSDIVHR